MPMPRHVPPLPLILLAAPIVMATAVILGVVAGELAGGAPLAAEPPRNIAEAAAVGDAATVLQFMSYGSDPTRIQPVRPELISSTVTQATTLEAAVWSRQIELIRVLDDRGAIIGPEERRELGCLAADLGVDDIVEYLTTGDPCVPGAAMERVLARSRSAEDGNSNE
jgi:hypothetical protein